MKNNYDFTSKSECETARIANRDTVRGVVQFEDRERIPNQIVGIEVFDSYTQGCAHYGATVNLVVHREGEPVNGAPLYLRKEEVKALIEKLQAALTVN